MVIRLALLLILIAGGARAESLRLMIPDVHPVVGEMIPITIRGEYSRRITLETLTFPVSGDYDWMQLARDSWRDERVDGRSVKVLERRIALFPRHAGPLTVGPLIHRLTVVGKSGGREALDVRTEPLTIHVTSFPAKSPPLSASALTVEDVLSTSPGKLRDGETLIRRVTLRADDTLPHLLPPRPAIRAPWLISFTAPEVRKVKPTPNGPETTVIWEWHLRPKTGEPGVLPPIEIPWFDTVSRQMRTAEIPALPFGYASFASNRTGADELPGVQVGTAWALLAAGLLSGLVLALAGLSRRKGTQILKVLKRYAPFDPTRKALKVAAENKDLLALRAAAERYLARRRALGLPARREATRDLDREIFEERSRPSTFDPDRFRRELLRRNRTKVRSSD